MPIHLHIVCSCFSVRRAEPSSHTENGWLEKTDIYYLALYRQSLLTSVLEYFNKPSKPVGDPPALFQDSVFFFFFRLQASKSQL